MVELLRIYKSIQLRLYKLFVPFYKRKWIVLFRYTKALGDGLFLTSVAHEIKRRNPDATIHVITGLPSLFDRNPDVDFVSPEPNKPINNIGPYLLHYESKFPWKENILGYCFKLFDIKDYSVKDYKTYIYPSDNDFNFADQNLSQYPNKKIVCISTIAGPRTDKKNWPIKYWELLITNLLKQGYVIVKIGLSYPELSDVNIKHENIIDLTGKTSIHQSAAIISKSDLLICPVTGVLHLAAAFNTKTLAIVGGSEPGKATQYPNGYFIENRPECADCYEQGPCVANHICLTEIKPSHVFKKAMKLLHEEN